MFLPILILSSCALRICWLRTFSLACCASQGNVDHAYSTWTSSFVTDGRSLQSASRQFFRGFTLSWSPVRMFNLLKRVLGSTGIFELLWFRKANCCFIRILCPPESCEKLESCENKTPYIFFLNAVTLDGDRIPELMKLLSWFAMISTFPPWRDCSGLLLRWIWTQNTRAQDYFECDCNASTAIIKTRYGIPDSHPLSGTLKIAEI